MTIVTQAGYGWYFTYKLEFCANRSRGTFLGIDSGGCYGILVKLDWFPAMSIGLGMLNNNSFQWYLPTGKIPFYVVCLYSIVQGGDMGTMLSADYGPGSGLNMYELV